MRDMDSVIELEAKEIVELLRDQAWSLAEGVVMSTVKERIEWRAADMIEFLVREDA